MQMESGKLWTDKRKIDVSRFPFIYPINVPINIEPHRTANPTYYRLNTSIYDSIIVHIATTKCELLWNKACFRIHNLLDSRTFYLIKKCGWSAINSIKKQFTQNSYSFVYKYHQVPINMNHAQYAKAIAVIDDIQAKHKSEINWNSCAHQRIILLAAAQEYTSPQTVLCCSQKSRNKQNDGRIDVTECQFASCQFWLLSIDRRQSSLPFVFCLTMIFAYHGQVLIIPTKKKKILFGT